MRIFERNAKGDAVPYSLADIQARHIDDYLIKRTDEGASAHTIAKELTTLRRALKLTPRQSDSEFEHLVLALDPATLQIRALTTRDHQGGDNTIEFFKLKENTNVSDGVFKFTPPRGVVVTGAGN